MDKLEKMDDFFTARVAAYDEHMLRDVEGCKEAYIEIAKHVPPHTKNLLDLGCGTGLELASIFEKIPDVSVTGVDLTQAMLDALMKKYEGRDIRCICGDYFAVDFGRGRFDCAVSFQTMHHFSHEEKVGLYKKVCGALVAQGVYIEVDYMVMEQGEEDFYYAENRRIRQQLQIPAGAFYHYDKPCTIENQTQMLHVAGFARVEQVFRMENTTMLVCHK